MRAVNLLPKTSGLTGLVTNRPQLLIIGAVGAVAIMGLWGYSANQSADSASAQLTQAQVAKSALDQQVSALGVYSERQQAVAAAQTVVNQLAVGRTNWERLIRDVVTVLPAGVSLNTVNGSLPTTTGGAAGSSSSGGGVGQANTTAPQGMHIVGDAYTQGEVAITMARIATVPGLGTPRLASSQVTNTSGKSVVAFTIDVPINVQALDVAAATPGAGSAATTAATTAGSGGTP
jgi:Tfp pilus assembly protein PilN